MEELLAQVTTLNNTVNRIEAMMLEDRQEKAQTKVVIRDKHEQNKQNRIEILEKNRDAKIKELNEGVDSDYAQELQDEIVNYNMKIVKLKTKLFPGE
jgi:hypothetical protein